MLVTNQEKSLKYTLFRLNLMALMGGGQLNYEFASYDENGSLCNPSPFSISNGNLSFNNANEQKSISTTYTEQSSCINARHQLKLTVDSTQDNVTTIINIAEGLEVNIILPPNILNVNVLESASTFELEAVVEDEQNLNLSYLWELTAGSGVSSGETTKTFTISDYNAQNGLKVLLTVNNADTGASSTLQYIIRSAGNTAPFVATASTLKQTSQNGSYDNSGNISNSIKDDGYYQIGKKLNYTKLDNIVKDNITKLMWQDDKFVETNLVTWDVAKNYCQTLTLEDHTDWRLPTVVELFDTVYYQFTERLNDYYWTSTIRANSDTIAFTVHPITLTVTSSSKTSTKRIRCVRSFNPTKD